MCNHPTVKRHRRWFAVAMMVTLAAPLGCSKEQRQQMAATVNQKASAIAKSTRDMTSRAVTAVEDQLPETGNVAIKMTPAVEPTAEANVEVIAIGDGRDNVVQIASYDVSSPPTAYPSLLIRGRTQVGAAASLSGQTVECEMYMQSSSSAPIAMTKTDEPVKVTFGSYDPQNKTVSATIGSVSLIGSDNNPISIDGGSVVAIISDGGAGL